MDSPRVNGSGPVQEAGGVQVWRLGADASLQDELTTRRLRLEALERRAEDEAA